MRELTGFFLGLLCLLGLFCSLGYAGDQEANCVIINGEEIPFYWKGTVKVRKRADTSPCFSGVYDTQWTLNLKLKQSKKYDVKLEKNEQLVGQFVKLEDYGSTWSGKEVGSYSTTDGPYCHEGSFSGQGNGVGDVINEAYIYYSFSENDPLSDVLPNKSYFICARSGLAAKFSTHETKTTIDLNSGHTNTSHLTWKNMAMLDYFIGKMFFGPTTQLSDPLYADEVLSKLSNFAMPAYDTQTRIIEDGKLKGSYKNGQDMGENLGVARKVINSADWNIVKRLDVDPDIGKARKDWRPKANGSETPVSISAELKEYPNLKGKWRFTLFEVSKEKGYCMNAGQDKDYDYEFVHGQPGFAEPKETDNGWEIETTETSNKVKVEILDNDYGAWAKIRAEVNVEGQWYLAKSEDGKEYVTIPYDDDEDHIADCWEEKNRVLSQEAIEDNDSKPEGTGCNREPGDGFSNYEEYRGFNINGEWSDTDPKHKDLFLCDQIGLDDGYYGKATGIHVHLINADEFNGVDSRVVNFNRGYGTLTSQDGQKGLWLREERLDGGLVGTAQCIGTPNVVKWVKITTTYGKAIQAYQGLGKYEGKYGAHLKNRACTITHELGHATNLTHHGNVEAYYGNISVARQGGMYSGNIDCFMRYHDASQYIYKDGTGPYDYPSEQEPKWRSIFCQEKTGTGFNDPELEGTMDEKGRPYPVAGDATEGGACLNNITLKGYHYNGK